MNSVTAHKHRSSSMSVRYALSSAAIASAALVGVIIAAWPAQAASSPTVVGQKYSDAKGALAGAGYSIVVSTTVGDQLARDDCVVTHQQDRTVPPPENTSAAPTKQTLLSLNCDDAVASTTKPGNSLASPEGRAAAAAAKASATATPSPSPKH
jgi:hypothetical protein